MTESRPGIHTANSFDWEDASLFLSDQDKMDERKPDSATNRRKKSFSIFDGLFKSPKIGQGKAKLSGFEYEFMPGEESAQPVIQSTACSSEKDEQRTMPSDGLQLPLAAMSLGRTGSPPRPDASLPPSPKPQALSRRESFVRPFKNLKRFASASLLGKREREDSVDDDLAAHGDRFQKTRKAPAMTGGHSSSQAIEILRHLEPIPQPPAMRERSVSAAHNSLSSFAYSSRSGHHQLRLPPIGHASGQLVERRRGMVFQDDGGDTSFLPPIAQKFSPRLDHTRRLPYPQWPPVDLHPTNRINANVSSNWPTTFTGLQDQHAHNQYGHDPFYITPQRDAGSHPATSSSYGAHYGASQIGQPLLVDFARSASDVDSQHGRARREVVNYPPMWLAEEIRHQRHHCDARVRHEQLPQQQILEHELPPILQPGAAGAAYSLPSLQSFDGHFRQDSIGVYTSNADTESPPASASQPRDAVRSRRGSRAQRQPSLLPIVEEGHSGSYRPVLPQPFVGLPDETFAHAMQRPTPRTKSAASTLASLSSIDHLNSAPRYSGHPSTNPHYTPSQDGPSSWSPSTLHPALRPTFEADAPMRSRIQLPHFEIAETRRIALLTEPVEIDWSSALGSEGGGGNYKLSSEDDADADYEEEEDAQVGVGYEGTPRVFGS